jgi:RNA polymerase sigma-70 factor (ECF subfamily)
LPNNDAEYRAFISIDAIPLQAGSGPDDEELATLLRERTPAAWETLYERHFEGIYRYALARLGDHTGAEDAAATTFQRGLSAIDRYKCQGKPVVAWLYGIARNVIREQQRLRAAGKAGRLAKWLLVRQNGTADQAASALVEVAVPDIAEASARSMDLKEALRTLTALQREAILLRYFSGLSAPEIAKVMNKPESAVYALQARALDALRRRLS